MPDSTTQDPPEFMAYSPEDVMRWAEDAGADPATAAQALKMHRDNIAAYAHDNYDAEQSWKAVAQLDRDTISELNKNRIAHAQTALVKALPDPQERSQFAAQLEAGGFDRAAVDDQWQHAFDAYESSLNDPQFHLPKQRSGGMFRLGSGNVLGAFNLQPRSDGHADVQFNPVGDGRKMFSLRVPIPTDKDIEEERARAKDAFAKAEASAKPWLDYNPKQPVPEPQSDGMIVDALRFLAAGAESDTAAAAAQRRTEALTAHGDAKARLQHLTTTHPEVLREELFNERLKQQLADPKYRAQVGDYNGAATFLKGAVVDNGTAALALGARVGDAINGNEDLMHEVNRIKQTYEQAYPDSTRRELEGGWYNDMVTGAQRSGGQMAPLLLTGGLSRLALSGAADRGSLFAAEELARQATGKLGVAGGAMGISSAGAAYQDTQQRIDAAEAAGDHTKAQRLRAGRDMHALLMAASEAAIERLGGAQALQTHAKGIKGFAKEWIKEGIEEPLTGLVQRGVVEPLTLGEHPDLEAPMLNEALVGLAVGAPVTGVSHFANRAQPNSANVTDGSPMEAKPGPLPASEVSGDAGSTPAVGASVVEPVAPVQRRMAERTLVSQGVEAEVAAAMVDHLGITPDMPPETLRDHVLNTFQEQGGQLPDSLPKRHLDQPAAYEAMGYTPEESQTHADNSRAIHEQDVQAAHDGNRALVTKLTEAAAARVAESQQRPVTEPVRAPGVIDDPSNAAFDQQAAELEAKLGAAQDNRFANSNDPRLSSDLKPGNLPADVSATLPAVTEEEANRLVSEWEPTVRADGQLRAGQRLRALSADEYAKLPERTAKSLAFARALAGVFGRRIVVVKGLDAGQFGGATHPAFPRTIFINGAKSTWHNTAGHELLHHLQNFHKDLYAKLDSLLEPMLMRQDAARRNYSGYSTTEEVKAEVYADFLSDSFHDPKFWDSLAQRQPTLFTSMARAVWSWFDKVLTALKGKGWESSQYFSDLLKARSFLADAMAEFAAREHGRSPKPADAAFRTEQSENFFSGKQDMQRPSPDDIAESMAARVRQLQSAEESLQDGWNLTRSTEMERTRDGEPIIPTAYAVRKNADMQEAGREWTNHFLEASAMKGVPDARLGEHVLEALRTGRNPHTGRAMSGDVTAAILHSLADRVHELGIDRRAYELALQENASRAGHNLQSFREAWDPMTKLKTEVDAKTETEMQQVTGGKDAATVTKELGEEVTREVAAEVRDVLDGARDDIADTAGAMPGSNLDQWLRGEGQQPVTLDMLVRQHLQTGRWAGERFQAAVRRLFPQLDAATATRITDAIHTALEAKDDGSHAGKRQEQRMSKAETIAGRWINKFAVSQSDTLSWSDPAKRAAHPLTVLIRAHLKELKSDFRARAQDLGATAEQARVLDMEIREEHRRKAMIKSTQERTRIEAARQRAIERYMKGFEPGAKKANRWAGYSTFVKKLVQAGDLGILDSQAFLDAFSLTYKLHGITAERVTRLKEMHDRIIATGEDGRPLLYGSVRETVEREFAQLLNTIAPAQSWMKFVDGQLTAGMLSGISTMVNQFSGVVRVFAGINALADAWQYRGLNPARAAQQWLGELRSLWDSKGLFATAIRGESLGIAPPKLLKMSPHEQQTQLLKPGEKLRVGKRELPGVVSTLARMREMYVWRFIRGVEGLSGVSDASRQFENLLIEHYRQSGMTAEAAARKAANDVHGSEAARAAAREQAQQEQQTGMIGKGEGALNKRVSEIIQHRLDVETGAQLTQRSEWLTSYWQFKTEPVSALGHGIAALGRYFTGPETWFGGRVPNVARFMIKFTRFLGHSFETGFHYVPGLHLLTKLHGELSGVREAEVKRVFGGWQAYNQMVDARAFAGFTMMLAMGGLSALGLAMRRRDDEEPFFTITGTAPFESFDTKQRLEASGKWGEQQVRMFGKPILNYGQVPELAAIFSIIGNLNDHARFGNTLGHLGEKDGHAPKELGQRVWEQGVDLGLAPVRRSTFRNMFEIVNALLAQDTTAPDKLAKFATAPLGAAVKLPVLTDVDRAMRTMEGPRRNQGWANNALRQVPFVIVGDKMINAYGQQVPGFGFLSAVPSTAPTFDPEAPSSRAAQLNLDTNTRRSTPDGPRLRNIVGQVVKLPSEEVAAFQQRAGRIYTRSLLNNEAMLRAVYRQQGASAAQKIVSRLSEEANRQARAEQGW